MVSSIGSMIGILLNFVTGWATADDNHPALSSAADYLVVATMLASLGLMILVLARLLTNQPAPEFAAALWPDIVALLDRPPAGPHRLRRGAVDLAPRHVALLANNRYREQNTSCSGESPWPAISMSTTWKASPRPIPAARSALRIFT
jgi:hypothetical protein